MIKNPWVTAIEAGKLFGVSPSTLDLWREVGYLQHGTCWRKYFNSNSKSNEYIYHGDWCKEKMDYWKSHNAIIKDIAA